MHHLDRGEGKATKEQCSTERHGVHNELHAQATYMYTAYTRSHTLTFLRECAYLDVVGPAVADDNGCVLTEKQLGHGATDNVASSNNNRFFPGNINTCGQSRTTRHWGELTTRAFQYNDQ